MLAGVSRIAVGFTCNRMPNDRLNVGTEGHGDTLEDDDRRVAASALDPAKVSRMNVCAMGQLLLREADLPPQLLHVPPHTYPHVHRATTGASRAASHRL